MKKSLTYFIFFTLILLSNLFSNELIKSIDSHNLKSISINLKTGGSIIITGSKEQKEILFKIISEKTLSNEDVRISKDNNTLNMVLKNTSNGNLKVNSVNISVPFNFNFQLKTIGGEIIISNITGKISGKTFGGDIKLSNITGSVKLKTYGGDIELKDSEVKGKLITMGGNILFDTVNGDIEGKSMGGNVIYKNTKKTSEKKINKAIRIDTMGGDIDVNTAPYGAIVKTMGGNIDIRTAKYFVKAKTMGGNIIIDSIQGSTDAITMGGNIKVTINKSKNIENYKTDLRSMKGDITIFIPEKLSILIDSEIIFFKSGKKTYKIFSDFNLDISQSRNWKKKNGTFQKTIKGISKVKKGKNKITLKTKNGNIFIKERRKK